MLRQYLPLLIAFLMIWIPEEYFRPGTEFYIAFPLFFITYSNLIIIQWDVARFVKKRSDRNIKLKMPLAFITIHYIYLILFIIIAQFFGRLLTENMAWGFIGFAFFTLLLHVFGQTIFAIRAFRHESLRIYSVVFILCALTYSICGVFGIYDFGNDIYSLITDISYTVFIMSIFSLYVGYENKRIGEIEDDILDA